MSLNETLNIKTSEKILRTTIIIIISLTNFHRGLTTYVEMDYIHDNEKIFSNIKSKSFLSDSSYGSTPIASSLSTSKFTTENQNHQSYRPHRTDKNDINDEHIANNDRRPKFESQNVVASSYMNKTKRLSSNLIAHKVIDLVQQIDKRNFYPNNTIDTVDEPAHNTPMYFGTENSTVIITQSGTTAHMSCIVHHIGECVVSWIRKTDYHLLTVGLTAYSSDERFSATHLKHSEDWTLQIKFVQERDSGVYECQVSTHPPTSIFFNLSVVVARAEISGPNIRYLTPGSTLRLQCHVIQNTENSEFIFWYHDNRMINYDADRGINVSTEPDFQSSELIITRTRRENSGNYTCVASNTQPASVLVHIFKGDNPAAMYHGHVESSQKSYQMYKLYTALMAILLICCSIFA